MSTGVLRFSGVGGIEVRLDPSLLALALLVGWVFTDRFRADHGLAIAVVMAIVGALLVVLTTFAHELGHALEARHRGIEVVAVRLLLFGGVTEMHAHGQSARDELAVAAVGPYVSLVCGAGFGIVATFADVLVPAPLATPIGDLAGVLGWWNVLLALFNLVPGAPLDGGRVLRALLWMAFGDRMRALAVSVRIGQVLGVAIACGGVWVLTRSLTAWLPATSLIVLGVFLVRAATSELAHARMDAAMEGRSVGELMGPRPTPLPASAPLATLDLVRFSGVVDLIGVTDGDRLVGVIEAGPLATRAVGAIRDGRLADLAEPLDGVPSVDLADDLHTLIERFQGDHHVVRLTDGTREIGALTEREVARALGRLRRQAGRGGRGRAERRGPRTHPDANAPTPADLPS